MSRAYRSLWILVTAAILFTGILAQALAAPASATADVVVAVTGPALVVSAVLLVRVLRYLTQPPSTPSARRQRRPRPRT